MDNAKRNVTIDIARGIGIMAVIAGHLLYSEGIAYKFIYAFHMPLFFFLSGLVMSSGYLSGGISKRIYAMLLNYVEICLVGAVFALLFPHPGYPLEINFFVYTVLLIGQPEMLWVGHAWFLLAMAWCFVLFFAVNNMFPQKKGFAAVAALVLFFVSLLLEKVRFYMVIGYFQLNDLWRLRAALSCFLFFELGYLFKSLAPAKKANNMPTAFYAAAFIISGAYTLLTAAANGKVNIAEFRLNNPVMYIAGALSGIIMVLSAARLLSRSKIAGMVLSFFGRNSLPVFLTHAWLVLLYWIFLARYVKHGVFATDKLYTTMASYTGVCLKNYAAVIGTVLICLAELPIIKVYDLTFKKLNKTLLKSKKHR